MEDDELESVLLAILTQLLLVDNPPESASQSIRVLKTIVENAGQSNEAKYRRLPCKNARILERIINTSGASEFLDAVGFVREDAGAGDFVLRDPNRLNAAAKALNTVAASLGVADSPGMANQGVLGVVNQGVLGSVGSAEQKVRSGNEADVEYNARRMEAEKRQEAMVKKREEERKQKEAIAKSIKAEQKDVRDRPVTASKAVHVARHDVAAASGSGGVRYVNSDAEFQKVISTKKFVLVNFTASWCGPCKAVAPEIDAMAAKYPNVTFIRVDIDANNETPGKFNVSSIPTFILFDQGKVKGEPIQGADAAKVEALVTLAR